MVESLAHLQLRPLHLSQAFDPLVFRDLLQIIWNAIEKRDNDVCMFKHSNIVCTVTSHERDVPKRIEGRKDALLLRRRDADIDPGVLQPSRMVSLRTVSQLLQLCGCRTWREGSHQLA